MNSSGFIKVLMYGVVSLTTIITSCGGEGRSIPPCNTGVGLVRQLSGEIGKTAVLTGINITPNNPLGISSGTQLQFTAMGSYSDNSAQDLTAMVVWTSSDISIATVSNAPGTMGLATAVSKGYCSISAALKGISYSTVIGVD